MNRIARGATVLMLSAAAVSTGMGGAVAATTVEHGQESQVDVNPDTENPCTGTLGELVDVERDNWTVATRADGSYVARGHSVTEVTFTPYGAGESYAGHETYSDVERVTRGSDGFRSTSKVRMRGSEGGLLVYVERNHLVIGPDGSVRVDSSESSLTCG